MTAYVFFYDFLQFDRCGSRRNRSIWHFCIRRAIRNKKQEKESEKK